MAVPDTLAEEKVHYLLRMSFLRVLCTVSGHTEATQLNHEHYIKLNTLLLENQALCIVSYEIALYQTLLLHLLQYSCLKFFMWKAFQLKDTVLPKSIFNEKCQFQWEKSII